MGIEAQASIPIDNLKHVPFVEKDLAPYSLSNQRALLDKRFSLLEKVKSLGRAKKLGLPTSSGLLVMGFFMGSSTLLELGGITLLTSFGVCWMHANAKLDFKLVEKLREDRGLKFDSE